MGIFYKDKKVFGFDIGHSAIKVMQIDQTKKAISVVAYGTEPFNPKAVENGIIIDPEEITRAAYQLIQSNLNGVLTTRRAAVSLPNEYSFNRVVLLPKMDKKDLAEAIKQEVDQSIPLANDQLYYDYNVTRTFSDGSQEIQIVACPKETVDSYLSIFDALGLEVALIESNISAVTRIAAHSEAQGVVTLIVDIGSTACDLSVYDGVATRVTGTVDCSSERITANIAKVLDIGMEQASSIKSRYGLGVSKRQAEIIQAAEPELNKLVNEIRKVMRYFTEKEDEKSSIGQIIILGGGANLPGLSTYITDRARVPTRLCAPWKNISFGNLPSPLDQEATLYTTASGLSMISPRELAA